MKLNFSMLFSAVVFLCGCEKELPVLLTDGPWQIESACTFQQEVETRDFSEDVKNGLLSFTKLWNPKLEITFSEDGHFKIEKENKSMQRSMVEQLSYTVTKIGDKRLTLELTHPSRSNAKETIEIEREAQDSKFLTSHMLQMTRGKKKYCLTQ